MTKNNIYLDALEYGEQQLAKRQQIEKKDLKNHLKNKGYGFSTKEERRLLSNIEIEAFHMYSGDPSNRKYYLNINGYFKLLEYRELNDARKSSKEARWYALLAITFSFLALATSIYFSYKELEQHVTIDKEQFNVIENIRDSLQSTDRTYHPPVHRSLKPQ